MRVFCILMTSLLSGCIVYPPASSNLASQCRGGTVGIAGGARIGTSSLAVAGGATGANIFPNSPELGKVQPLPSGTIPGTNINVGSATPTGPLTSYRGSPCQ